MPRTDIDSEIDRVRVVGRRQPVTICEPLALASATKPEVAGLLTAFAVALSEYRNVRFAAAARLFDGLAARDAPARVFAERAHHWISAAPP